MAIVDVVIERVVSGEQVRIWAGLQGFVSLAAVIALALFYALATPLGTPQRRWFWLGPVNDWLAVIGAGPWIVAMVLLAMYVRAGPWLWTLTVLACAGAAAIAVVTILMLTGRVGLPTQAVVGLIATIVALGWMAVAAGVARSSAVIPAWVWFLAIAILVAFVVGGILAGIGFLAPAGSAVQTVLYAIGITIGGASWFAFPIWWLILAATLN